MILSQISYLDCVVFLIFLAPQLLIHVGLFTTARWVIGAFPYLGAFQLAFHPSAPVAHCVQVLRLPYDFVKERYFTPLESRTPFVQRATPFQDIVIRCVRYAFANMPAYIGRVFFSKAVSLPFLRFRMLRHGYIRSPLQWREINQVSCSLPFKTVTH